MSWWPYATADNAKRSYATGYNVKYQPQGMGLTRRLFTPTVDPNGRKTSNGNTSDKRPPGFKDDALATAVLTVLAGSIVKLLAACNHLSKGEEIPENDTFAVLIGKIVKLIGVAAFITPAKNQNADRSPAALTGVPIVVKEKPIVLRRSVSVITRSPIADETPSLIADETRSPIADEIPLSILVDREYLTAVAAIENDLTQIETIAENAESMGADLSEDHKYLRQQILKNKAIVVKNAKTRLVDVLTDVVKLCKALKGENPDMAACKDQRTRLNLRYTDLTNALNRVGKALPEVPKEIPSSDPVEPLKVAEFGLGAVTKYQLAIDKYVAKPSVLTQRNVMAAGATILAAAALSPVVANAAPGVVGSMGSFFQLHGESILGAMHAVYAERKSGNNPELEIGLDAMSEQFAKFIRAS